MEPRTTAGHRFSERRARLNRAAVIFLLLCGINGSVYICYLEWAIASGDPVSFSEHHRPNVLSFQGRRARVEPAIYRKVEIYGDISSFLGVACVLVNLFLYVFNARLPASAPPHPLDELGPIRISADGVAHSGGSQWPVVLPRSQIERLELQHASARENLTAARLYGVFFALLGLPLTWIALTLERMDLEAFCLLCLGSGLAAMGIWLVVTAIQKRYVLVAYTPKGRSRMIFPRAAAREDVIQFVTSAIRRHEYPFDFGPDLVG